MEITVKGPFTVISHGMRWIKIRKSGSVYCMWINKIGGIIGGLSYCVAAYHSNLAPNCPDLNDLPISLHLPYC